MSDLSTNYSSYLVDSHITEHDASFLRKLDPANFVEMMKMTGADSIMVYACCHNGNCYYPTRVGHMHKNLDGRDHFGQTVALLRKQGISPRAYYTVVYHRQAARDNPDWRVCQIDGAQSYRRSWHCCPNSTGYRAFAGEQIREISSYPIDSIFIDMTFWPGICYCHSCRARFLNESNAELPTTVDWTDPIWVRFQRSRERWLAEFAHEMTAAAKEVNPNIGVAHQFSPVLLGWMYGQSHDMSLASDVPSGDFYGGKYQHRFGAKVMAAFQNRLPFEFMTSRCVTLYDHTSTKSDEELLVSCATTLANAGTCMLIDAINTDGTLEKAFYQRVNSIAEHLRPFKCKLAELRPTAVADTGLYYSMPSHVRNDHNSLSVRQIMNPANNMLAASDLRPVQEVLGTAIVLSRCHMPYRILHNHTTDFGGLRTIIVNDASFMSGEEADRLRQFVKAGGTLIATGMTSYRNLDGQTSGDFALADVFGVTFTGQFTKRWNYLAPETGALFSCDVPAPLVKATTADVLARVAEPLFDPEDFEHYASFHSNPPGKPGPCAGLTINRFGAGTCIYLYSSALAKQQDSQQSLGEDLVRRLAGGSSLIRSTNAPPAVEITLLRGTQGADGTFLLCAINQQDETPAVPVRDLRITFSLPDGYRPLSCTTVSNGRALEMAQDGDAYAITLPHLATVEMIQIDTTSKAGKAR